MFRRFAILSIDVFFTDPEVMWISVDMKKT